MNISQNLPFKKKQDSIFENTKQLVAFMKVMNVSRRSVIVSIVLSVFAVILNVIAIRLLMDILRGMISHDFTFVREMAGFRHLITLFPEAFGAPHSNFALLIITVFLLTLSKNGFQYASSLSVGCQVREATRSLRELIFDRYLIFGKLYYDRVNLGRLHTVLIKFSQAISTQLNSLQRLASQVFALVGYFGIMLFISWPLTLLTLIIFPFFVFLSESATKHFRDLAREHARSEERLDERIFGILSSIPLVKAHGTEELEKKIFREVNEAEAKAAFKLDKKEKLILPVQEIHMTVAFLVLASTITFFVPEGNGHIANYLVFFYLVRLSLPGFSAVNQLRMGLNQSSVRIDRVQEILDDEKKFIIPEGKLIFARLKNDIECRHLSFAYRENAPVLKDISLKFEKGRMTAIVGPTGAGKTTLVHLLLRFYDCPAGTILVDGKDIRDFTLKSLVPHFAYVSQEAFFFNDTLKMNMTYGLATSVNEERLVEVAQKARLYDFIMGLPMKFETRIGERAVQLSGGEKQRLSIARALLRDAEILILDEATSSLDSKTEKLIQEAIGEAVRSRTTIVIAHRFSTIQYADKIIVLESGRVAEEGSQENLMALRGKFYTYWNEQRFF